MGTRDMSVAETLGSLESALRDAIAGECAALAEVERLGAEVARVTAERDALRAAVDAHVEANVSRHGALWRTTHPGTGLYDTRADAEAAYRKKTGLDVPAPATVARDDDGSPDWPAGGRDEGT